ncbi:hypothetical protein D3C80_1277050 [compost metagenome]
MIARHAAGFLQPGRAGRQLLQLQEQALAEVARADAQRLELLHAVQDHLHLVQLDVQFGIERLEDLLEAFVEIAVVVDRIDDRHGDQPVVVAHRRQVELPEQVAVQAFARRGAGGEVPLVIVADRQAAGTGLVDVFPGGIHRQFAGDALAPLVGIVHAVGIALAAGADRAVVAAHRGRRLAFCQRVAVVEIVAIFLAFEHGIRIQGFLDFLLQIEGRQLQEANGLLQLRGHRQLLAHLED